MTLWWRVTTMIILSQEISVATVTRRRKRSIIVVYFERPRIRLSIASTAVRCLSLLTQLFQWRSWCPTQLQSSVSLHHLLLQPGRHLLILQHAWTSLKGHSLWPLESAMPWWRKSLNQTWASARAIHRRSARVTHQANSQMTKTGKVWMSMTVDIESTMSRMCAHFQTSL